MNDEIRAFAENMRQHGASAQEIEKYIQGAIERQVAPSKPIEDSWVKAPVIAKPDAAKDAAAVVQAPGEGKSGDMERLRDLGLGLATAAPQAIPGVEAAQAGIRSVARNQPYGEALSDMRAETDPIPAPLKLAVQAPAIAATGRLPISPALSGAALGGFSQLLNADPNQSFGDRAFRTVLGAGAGAALGKTLDIGGNLGRAWLNPRGKTAGALTKGLEDKMGAADAVNYGAATKEGASSPAQIAGVRKILNRPTVRAFAKDVRRSEKFAKAPDAEILTETYASMSAAERSLKDALAKEYDPAKARTLGDIVDAKRNLLGEADKIMPSFRPAAQAHAVAEEGIDAVGTGVDAAKRAFGGTPAGDRVPYQSVESFADRIRAMTPENRKLAVKAALAELKQRTGFQPNAVSLGGLLTSIRRPMQMTSLLRAAGDEGQKFSDLIIKTVLGAGFNAGR